MSRLPFIKKGHFIFFVCLYVAKVVFWSTPEVTSPQAAERLPFFPVDSKLTNLGFDKTYLINLKRRPDRLWKMTRALDNLRLDFEVIAGTDGRKLTQKQLVSMGITLLPGFKDPYTKRFITFGEVGCFLSHYRIWNKMLELGVRTALILEDDVYFERYFNFKVQRLFREARNISLDWDLMFLGRKPMTKADEPRVKGSKYISHLDYSYWTLGYVLTLRGAKKLLDARPLEKIVPVDEFLSIMFDRHGNIEWKEAFPSRELKAYSAIPLLVQPAYGSSNLGYYSDTEGSETIEPYSYHIYRPHCNIFTSSNQSNCNVMSGVAVDTA